MCLFRRGLCKTADKDIICYKVLSVSLLSQYYNFQYELGKLYKKKWDSEFIKYCESKSDIGGNAFHACLVKDFALFMYGEQSKIVEQDGVQITVGKLGSAQVLVKCIVPAGSKYFNGISNEIAVEQIKIVEICA